MNSPHEFPDLGLTGTVLSNALVPFPPNDQQYYVGGKYDPVCLGAELDEISGKIPGATASNFVGIVVENSSDVLELVRHRLLIRPEEHS